MLRRSQFPVLIILMILILGISSCASKRGRICRCPQWSFELPATEAATNDFYASEV